MKRESVKKEVQLIRKRKNLAETLQEEWIHHEYTMTQQPTYTKRIIPWLCYKSSAAFLALLPQRIDFFCKNNESVCIIDVALRAIDSVLCQKKENNEFSKAAALARTRNSKKRKRTPNTTRGDDGIGILMYLREHKKEEAEEDSVNQIASLTKNMKII